MSLERLQELYDDVKVLTADNLKPFQQKFEAILRDSFDEPLYKGYKLKIHNIVMRATMQKIGALIGEGEEFDALLRKDYTALIDTIIDHLKSKQNPV